MIECDYCISPATHKVYIDIKFADGKSDTVYRYACKDHLELSKKIELDDGSVENIRVEDV